MPGVQDKPPSSQEIQDVRQKALQKLGDEGISNFIAKDIERLKSSDDYVTKFWKHVFDLPGQQGDEAAAMILKTFKWKKEFGVDKIEEKSLNQSVVNKGSLFTHNRDKDGMKLIVLAMSKHVKGADSIDDVKKLLVYYFERLDREEDGKKISWVFDCKGAGLRNMDLDLVNFIITCMESYYPDILNYIYIFEMPWIMGAAFKVVKAALPAAGVAKLKDVTKSSFSQWIDDDNRIEAWGGNDDWQYKFEPEVIKKKQETVRISHNESIYEEPTEIRQRRPPPSSTASSMGNMSRNESDENIYSYSSVRGDSRSQLLRVNPDQEVIFSPSSSGDLSARVQLTNVSDKIAAYKMKTTSPEKFRVRPSTGSLGQGQTTTIEIHVSKSQVPNAASLVRDKFLISAITLDSHEISPQMIQQMLKKGKPEGQYRLRCQLSSEDALQPSHTSNGTVSSNMAAEVKKEADKVMKKLREVLEKQENLESQMMFVVYGGIGILTVTMLLLIILIFFNSCPEIVQAS